jgi:hypothetical protein
MKKLTLIAFLLISFSHSSNAQQQDPKIETDRLMGLFHKLDGTFQLQIIDSRDKTELPLYIMDTIIAKRHATEVVYFPLRSNVRVMVLPLSEINKQGFIPLERIVNIFTKK